MEPVRTILMVLARIAPALTVRTAQNLGVLFRGAVLATGPRTVTSCLVAAWPWWTKHWSAYANVLRRARLDMRGLARTLFRLIAELIPPGAVIDLAVDEMLVRRCGPRVTGHSVAGERPTCLSQFASGTVALVPVRYSTSSRSCWTRRT